MRKEKGKAIQSESDDDEIPFSELREKIIGETHGSLTEKEPTSETRQTEEDRNVEAVRKEKGKAIQSESDDDEIPFSELREKIIAETHGSLQTEEDSSIVTPNAVENVEAVDTKVAKDFGSVGVFIGTVLSVEYDSDDDIKAKPFYCVEYTDGDREDLNEEEFGYAKELCFQMELDAEDEKDNNAVTSSSEEDESYRPSPKVTKLPSVLFCSNRRVMTHLSICLLIFRKSVPDA